MFSLLIFVINLLEKVVVWNPFLRGFYKKLVCIAFRRMVKRSGNTTYYSDKTIINSIILHKIDPDGYEELYKERLKSKDAV